MSIGIILIRTQIDFGITSYRRVPSVLPRHQDVARGSAYGRAGVKLSDASSFCGKPIEMGRMNPLLSVASEITVTEIIRQDEQDVRTRRSRCVANPRDGDYRRTAQSGIQELPATDSHAKSIAPNIAIRSSRMGSFTTVLWLLKTIVGRSFGSSKRSRAKSPIFAA